MCHLGPKKAKAVGLAWNGLYKANGQVGLLDLARYTGSRRGVWLGGRCGGALASVAPVLSLSSAIIQTVNKREDAFLGESVVDRRSPECVPQVWKAATECLACPHRLS